MELGGLEPPTSETQELWRWKGGSRRGETSKVSPLEGMELGGLEPPTSWVRSRLETASIGPLSRMIEPFRPLGEWSLCGLLLDVSGHVVTTTFS